MYLYNNYIYIFVNSPPFVRDDKPVNYITLIHSTTVFTIYDLTGTRL